ncbi:SDR family NAD(P)-dependent oxidoreductase [Subtercola boreus]|uniref:Shikimate dehydrogenase n=1 Tax=Subtercola boreus TaxID=120213 RepID=A0A3E0W8F2_9MICO|nr:glucose 1-dehydrogenase [Subtercola boreus]RFA18072.1 shikimate dehydrogenase [Subtercola boreus]RFA18454.1 shikimate dehydrogenase [Subtercola boreus]RFA24983.1 shikimate dehydrogenase [Subtercola boreus]
MTARLQSKTIIVTGAASGIGAGIARGMAAEGANIVIADLNLEAAEAVAGDIREAGGSAIAVRVDVTDEDQVAAGVAAAVAEFGRLDVYFNNAGLNAPENFLDITKAKWDLILNVNSFGVVLGTQQAVKQFIAQGGGGKVVNTASIAGRQGFPSFAPYSASKAAVISLTQAAARSFAGLGITVNAFAPGVVATPLWDQLDRDLADMGQPDAGFEGMSGDILLGRPATPADLVPTAVFLASSDSDYITGQVIAIEGGMILV